MDEIGARLLRLPADLRTCLAFFTRLPIAVGGPFDLRSAAAAWPILGLLVGAGAALVLLLAGLLGLSSTLAAVFATAAAVALSGGLHEDGLADTADGIGGGRSVEAKLAIMRDSRIGTYGVLALVLTLAVRIAAVAALALQPRLTMVAILVAASASRTMAMWHWHRLPPARYDGLARQAGSPDQAALTIATIFAGVAFIVAVAMFGWAAALGFGAAVIGVLLLSRLCRAAIGGHTGDTIGAAQQVAEALLLAGLSSNWLGH